MTWQNETTKYNRRTVFIGLFAVGVLIYLAFRLGAWHQSRLNERIEHMHSTIDHLNQQNQVLTRQLTILGVELEVEQVAAQKTQLTIQEALEQNNALKRELTFYQKVMAPELEAQGVIIESFHVEQTLSDNYFRYALVLMQRNKRTGYVKGSANIELVGSEQGKPKRYNLLELDEQELLEDVSIHFQFKYFDVVEGHIALPENFLPERIHVTADVLKGGKLDGRLQRTFDWNSLVQG